MRCTPVRLVICYVLFKPPTNRVFVPVFRTPVVNAQLWVPTGRLGGGSFGGTAVDSSGVIHAGTGGVGKGLFSSLAWHTDCI